mgnify:CR=1 FL=1
MISNPDPDDVRALFPGLYSRRDEGSGTYWDRNWHTLEVPVVRLMGPLWSFAATLKPTPPDTYETDVFLEHPVDELIPGHNLPNNPPTVMRADIGGLWDGGTDSRSRLNLVAVNTVQDGELILPMGKVEFLDDKTAQLVLAPFGRPPKHLGKDESGDPAAHLAAMQMVAGTIWLKAPDYMPVLRSALGLEQPEFSADELALTPSGAGFRAKITLPWSSDPVEGWLKLTLRDRDDETLSPELQIWTEPDGGLQWQQGLDSFLRRIDAAAEKAGLKWFGLTARRQIRPVDVFWPCSFDDAASLPLLNRAASTGVGDDIKHHALHLDSAALEPAIRGQSGRALTMDAPRFEIWRDYEDGVKIEAANQIDVPDSGPLPRTLNVLHSYQADKESVTVTQSTGDLNFAVPLQSNATRLREAMGFAEPHPIKDEITAAPLWLFTPIADGWLHWPFPNATTALLAKEIDTFEEGRPVRQSVSAGAWFVGTSEAGTERTWGLSFFAAAKGYSLTRLLEVDDAFAIDSHTLEFTGLSGSVDGMVPVTAFTQRPEQLLPEPQTRALAPTALSAVSPDLLTGLEAELWKKKTLRADLAFGPSLTLIPSGESVKFAGAPKSLTVTWPKEVTEGFSPRIWIRHDQLPTFQTLPLCVAGDRRNEPSGTRELSPLVGKEPTDKQTGIAFSGQIDMSAPHIELDYALKNGPLTGSWTHPLGDAKWANEIGQVFPTLGSVTVFPGLAATKRHAIKYETGFGSVPELNLGIDIGHALATTYELHAFSTLPPPDPEEVDEDGVTDKTTRLPPVSDPVFRPGAWNAPDEAFAGGNVWMGVWADLNRKLALSAVEKSNLVDSEDGKYFLPHVMLDQSYDLTGRPEIDTMIGFGESESEWQTEIETVAHFGRLDLKLSIEGRPQPLSLQGLPSTEELSGLTVRLARAGLAVGNVDIELGTLRSVATKEQPLKDTVDQGGWGTGTPVLHDHAISRPHTRYRGGKSETWDLMTGLAPFEIKQTGRPSIKFGIQDLPCIVTSGWTFSASIDPETNSLSTDVNPLEGYSWWLEQEGGGDQILVGNLAFRPTHLRSVKLSDTSDATEAVLTGRISVPVPDSEEDNEARFAEALGEVTLTITWKKGEAELVLTAEEPVELPLADPERAWPPVPWIEVHGMKYSADGFQEGTFRLNATAAGLALNLWFGKSADSSAKDGPEFRSLQVIAKEWNLGLLSYNGTWIVEPAAASVTIQADFDLNDVQTPKPAKTKLAGVADLVAGTMSGTCAVILGDNWKSVIPFDSVASALSREAHDSLGFKGLFDLLSYSGLAAHFTGPDDDAEFCGLATSGQSATVQLSLEPDPSKSNNNTRTFFRVKASSVTARIDHEYKAKKRAIHHRATLLYTSVMPSPSAEEPKVEEYAHLYLDLQTENDIAFPAIDVADNELNGPYLTDSVLKHFAKVTTAGTRIDLRNLQRDEYHFAATVLHTIERDDKEILALELTQGVVLMHPDSASTEIADELYGTTSSVFNPGSSKAAIHTHLDNTARALPHGLSVGQIDKIKAGSSSITGPTIFAGTHVLLRDPKHPATGKLHHLPLPFISAPGIEDILHPVPTAWQARRAAPELFDPLDTETRGAITLKTNTARDDLAKYRTDFADQLIGANAALHRPMFIGRTEISTDGGMTWAPSDQIVPGAETGLLLSAWFPGANASTEAYALVAPAPDIFRLLREPFARNSASIPHYTTKALTESWRARPVAADRISPKSLTDFWQGLPAAADHISPGRRILKDSGIPAGRAVSVRLLARNSNGLAITEIARTDIRLEAASTIPELEKGLVKWAMIGLRQRSPWARSGHLILSTPLSTADPVLYSVPVFARRQPDAINKTRSSLVVGPRFAEPQRVGGRKELETGLSKRLLPGYRAAGSHAEVLTSEPERVLNETETDALLTSVATVSAFALATPGARHIFGEEEAGWISDRETFAPRPPKSYDPETQPVLAPIRPPGTDLPRPAADHPAASPQKGLPTDTSDTSRAFVPASQIVASVGSRAGEMCTRRLGLAVQPNRSSPALAQAGDAVMATRSARPVILGVNDRTRASSHERMHFAASRTPEAFVHGPGVPITGLETIDEALLREPRSLFAFTLALRAPSYGLVAPGISGAIKLQLERVFGNIDDAVEWKVSHASILVGSWRYIASREIAGFSIEPGTTITISDFTTVFRNPPDAPASVFDAIARQNLGSEAELTLILSGNGAIRVVTFPLFARSVTAPLIEEPVFLRFDDPEYNDLLAVQPLSFTGKQFSGSFDVTLYTDRNEVAPSDMVVFGLALDLDTSGGKVFKTENDTLYIVGKKEENIDQGVAVTINLNLVRNGEAVELIDPLRIISIASDSFATINIPLFLFSASPQADDRLTVTIADQEARLNIKEEPAAQENPAGYGLIRLDMPLVEVDGKEEEDKTRAAGSLPLYGRGTRATVIEMVDPRDMELGRVRQRAMYRWHTFQYAAPDEASRMTLQKIGRTGSTWLPASLRKGWLPINLPNA